MQLTEAAADAIELQCCVEIRPPSFSQGTVRPLYLAARQCQGGSPMLLAASTLLSSVRPGDAVIIATGFHVPDLMPRGETDGPPGAAVLAWALSVGLGAIPLLLGETPTLEPIRAAARSVGLVERDLDLARAAKGSYTVDAFPSDGRAEGRARELLESLRPAAVIVIEKPGLNFRGVAHRAGGKAIQGERARVEVLTGAARAAGIPTIAIGDNGNEAGMGGIVEAVRRHKQYGETCLCPCGGGIAAVDEVDVTVVGSVSNWAAYGIAACLAIAIGDDRLLHDGEAEKRVIADCLRVGAVDGATLTHRFMVDGIPAHVNGHVVDILRQIVLTNLGRV